MSLLDTASLVVTPNGTKASKLYSVVPSSGAGDLDVTRATTATRVNSSGLIESVASNVPRLDYTNGECPSILVEPQRTNLLTYSEDLTQWVANSDISTTTLVSNPLTGLNNATKITKVTSSSDPFVTENSSAINGIYTYSVYLWTDSGQPTDVTLFLYNDSVTEVFTLPITLTTTPTRYQYTSTFVNTGGNLIARIDLSASATNQFIYAYGTQLEQGSYATSYIPTTSASVTRNADVISKTGISSLIGQTEGTMFIDVYRPNLSSGFIFMLANSVGANAYLNSIYLFQTPTAQLACDIFIAGVQQVGITTSSSGLSVGRNKIAIAYKQNDFVLYINGTQIGSDTSGNIPTLSAFEINGADISSVSNIQNNLTALWKTRLTNTQLATLTTI
jgi:hypothetical protein